MDDPQGWHAFSDCGDLRDLGPTFYVIVPRGVVYERRASGGFWAVQAAIAGSLRVGVSLNWARPSSAMKRRATPDSSVCSNISAPTRRMTASVFGNMPPTSARRFTSAFRRSMARSNERSVGDL